MSQRSGTFSADLSWYAVRVPPQKEFAAERILRDDGFNVFLPIEHKVRRANRYAKKKETFAYPQLVRYLFVGFEAGPVPWLKLFRFRLVQSVVGHSGLPVSIPAKQMARVFSLSKAPIPNRRSINPHRSFQAGDMVEIMAGPFSGRQVKVEEIRCRGDGEGGKIPKSARILMEIFGTTLDVDIPLDQLDAA